MTGFTSLFLGSVGAVALLAAPAAMATVFHPGDPQFTVNVNTDGSISAVFRNDGITGPTFTDIYEFTINDSGTGSGSVITTAGKLSLSTFTRLDSVKVNGVLANEFHVDPATIGGGWVQSWSITNVPIIAGQLNTIEISGFTRGNGSYGGQATFTPAAVPEPASWAMLVAGFGLVGVASRRRRNTVAA